MIRLPGLLERTEGDCNKAAAAIRAFEEDIVVAELVDWLEEIGERIKGEWDGRLDAGTYAASVVEGVLGDGSPEYETFIWALCLSLQWDSDPASAVAWLRSQAE